MKIRNKNMHPKYKFVNTCNLRVNCFRNPVDLELEFKVYQTFSPLWRIGQQVLNIPTDIVGLLKPVGCHELSAKLQFYKFFHGILIQQIKLLYVISRSFIQRIHIKITLKHLLLKFGLFFNNNITLHENLNEILKMPHWMINSFKIYI